MAKLTSINLSICACHLTCLLEAKCLDDCDFRHPVTNEYLPSRVQGEIILRKEGDLSDKLWDEEALRRWEQVENGGRGWTGRR